METKSITPEAAWFSVVRAYQVCTQQYEAMLSEFGLTVPQFDVLSAVRSLGTDALPKNIAERLLVTRGNISGLLKRLEQHGLIAQDPHPEDGRARVCRLTATGQDRLYHARAAAARFIEAQLAPFSADDMARTHMTMTKMATHLRALDPHAIAHNR